MRDLSQPHKFHFVSFTLICCITFLTSGVGSRIYKNWRCNLMECMHYLNSPFPAWYEFHLFTDEDRCCNVPVVWLPGTSKKTDFSTAVLIWRSDLSWLGLQFGLSVHLAVFLFASLYLASYICLSSIWKDRNLIGKVIKTIVNDLFIYFGAGTRPSGAQGLFLALCSRSLLAVARETRGVPGIEPGRPPTRPVPDLLNYHSSP